MVEPSEAPEGAALKPVFPVYAGPAILNWKDALGLSQSRRIGPDACSLGQDMAGMDARHDPRILRPIHRSLDGHEGNPQAESELNLGALVAAAPPLT